MSAQGTLSSSTLIKALYISGAWLTTENRADTSSLRPALLQAIDRIERSATDQLHKAFGECSAEDRERLLREFEAIDASDAFNMVRDFTYEAYYGHPRVLAALEKETGWSSASPTRGSAMRSFDASRLERVRKMPARWRKA